VTDHQSGIPFVSFSYEINDRFRPELRPGTDSFFDNLPLELSLVYDVINEEDYEFYLGLGARVNAFEGAVIPIGLNVYPLKNKNIGVHMEIAPIIGDAELLRGSWGIRYRFGDNG
jgi:hypothetical protein